jgi:hypothetical protein
VAVLVGVLRPSDSPELEFAADIVLVVAGHDFEPGVIVADIVAAEGVAFIIELDRLQAPRIRHLIHDRLQQGVELHGLGIAPFLVLV